MGFYQLTILKKNFIQIKRFEISDEVFLNICQSVNRRYKH